jgi:pyruvate kinase
VTILGVSTKERLWTAFGAWSSIYMNLVPSLNSLDEASLTQIAKTWGAMTGEKILIVRNEDVRELTLK